MSTFEVKVIRISNIEEIPGADVIELARIADYRSVVQKGMYKKDDLAVYIPEQSVLPDWLIERMNLVGKLAGLNKNRVKAIKLRKCLSQGLLYPLQEVSDGTYNLQGGPVDILGEIYNSQPVKVIEGQDVAHILDIKKYEPKIPAHLAGEVCNIGLENVVRYDFENLKRYPDIFVEGEEVVVTEKLHGTFCEIGYVPGLNHPEIFEGGDVFVGSKGLTSQGLVFKNNEQNNHNVYVMEFNSLNDGAGSPIISCIKNYLKQHNVEDKPVYLFGEIFGKGIQDLTYGQDGKNYRIFDIYVGKPGSGSFVDYEDFVFWCEEVLDLTTVPILYKGPYSREKMDELAQGPSTFDSNQIREGIVIKPIIERSNDAIGRVILKHINEAYLLRKAGTEFN